MKNPKHDRTHARTPTDLERKYDFGQVFGEVNEQYGKQSEQLRAINQVFSIFATNITQTIEELKNDMVSLENVYQVGSIYISVTDADPSTVFGGTWELIAQGHFVVSLERESEESLTELHETLDICYVWKKTA